MFTYIENVKGGRRLVKRFIKRLWRVVSIDEDAIFKSGEWPYLWSQGNLPVFEVVDTRLRLEKPR
jgi:hypothetical protein